MHDKNSKTSERVLWTQTGNLYTDDVHKAAKVMAWTDMHADDLKRESGGSASGRKTETGAVYHYSLSWAIGETPDQMHQKNSALTTLERLGLSEHQYYIVAHDDTKHAHIHIVANLTHPETGKRAELGLDKRALQAWALEYEREHGLYCEMREHNAKLRQKENAQQYYPNKKEIYGHKLTRAYEASDSGQSFQAALELEGLTLANGRKSFVAVDREGEVINLARMIEGRSTKEIKAKLDDLNRDQLMNADQLSVQRKSQQQERTPEHEKTTGEIAEEYIKLAHDPLSDVQRWNDSVFQSEQEQNRSHRFLPDQSYQRTVKHSELRQVREQDYFDRDRYEHQQQDEIDQAGIEFVRERRQKTQDEKRKIREARYAQIQQYIDKKTAASREHWKIDVLEKKRDLAEQELNERSGFFSRWFFRRRYLDVKDQYQNVCRQLEDALGRHKDDIDAFNRNRPENIYKAELEKHGFSCEKRAQTIQREQLEHLIQDINKAIERKQRLLPQFSRSTPQHEGQCDAQLKSSVQSENRVELAEILARNKVERQPVQAEPEMSLADVYRNAATREQDLQQSQVQTHERGFENEME